MCPHSSLHSAIPSLQPWSTFSGHQAGCCRHQEESQTGPSCHQDLPTGKQVPQRVTDTMAHTKTSQHTTQGRPPRGTTGPRGSLNTHSSSGCQVAANS